MKHRPNASRVTPCDCGHVNNPAKQTLLTVFATVLANVLIGLRIDRNLDMDFLALDRVPTRRLSDGVRRASVGVVLLVWAVSAAAVGTGAGGRVDSIAQMTFNVGGVAQPLVTSNAVSVVVDEVLDAVVIDQDAAPVSSASGAIAVPLAFSVTNTGNGSEPFRLAFDTAISGDNFDPTGAAIYLESNGAPGLQIGSGGDIAYVAGSNDPILAHDTSVSVYVASNMPVGLANGSLGRTALRAVPRTVFVETGTDDPANPAFPSPGASYPGAGDAAIGGGNTIAIVGTTFASGALRLLAQGTYRIDAAVVTLNKIVTSITDPTGGNRLVPGSVLRYQIDVSVTGSSTAQSLVVRDPLPTDLAYVAASLAVSPLPSGQQVDDDFAPTGSDNTGFDGANNTVVVTLGDVVGSAAPVVISFNATIR